MKNGYGSLLLTFVLGALVGMAGIFFSLPNSWIAAHRIYEIYLDRQEELSDLKLPTEERRQRREEGLLYLTRLMGSAFKR